VNIITARHLVKTQAKATRRRIFFSIDPRTTMPATWSEADFARECVRYTERKEEIEALELEQDKHKKMLLDYFRENDLKEFTVVNHTIAAVKKTKKTYTRKCQREEQRLKDQIKAMKSLEEDNGDCTVEVNEFNHISVKHLGDEME